MRYNICKITCWLASLLMVSIGTTSAQEKSDVFRARFAATRNVAMNVSFSKSDTIDLSQYLNTRVSIYSLSVDATIEQPRESSFTRIVLEDSEGRDHLVLECDHFRYDQDVVNLSEFCQETALLFGIIPSRLKCYVAGDAHIKLNSIKLSDTCSRTYKRLSLREQGEKHKELRYFQTKRIVEMINSYNRRHSKLWAADINPIVLMPYNDCVQKNTSSMEDAYDANNKYYSFGFYEIGEREVVRDQSSSLYVDSFDWRHRHGKNYWMTIPKNQWDSNWCVPFASISVIEALSNLYFNKDIDLDLSEADVAYNNWRQAYKSGTSMNAGLSTIKRCGAIDEDAYPFVPDSNQTFPNNRPAYSELVTIDSTDSYYPSIQGTEGIKPILMKYGPCVSGYYGYNSPNHAMALVGYGHVTADDVYRFFNATEVIDDSVTTGDSRIGLEYWIFKDNYYNHPNPYFHTIYGQHEGYQYIIFNNPTKFNSLHYVKGKINRMNHTDNEIEVLDEDGDGYFNWGIGPKPSHCPAWAQNQPDGDDSDRTKGNMNIYGYCAELSQSLPSYQYIYNDTTLTASKNWNSYLGIIRGATVAITAQQTFSNGTKLLLDNGATLILNGTVINGSSIQPYEGSKIFLNNGAKISKPFEVPLGVELIINNGKIE